MRIFEVIDDKKVVRYVCRSKSTKVPQRFTIIGDVTKMTKVDCDFLEQELNNTSLPSPIKLLIVALVHEHQAKIFGEE